MTANWRQESFAAKAFGNLGNFLALVLVVVLFVFFFACSGSAFKSLTAGCEGDEEADSWFIILYMNKGLRHSQNPI